MVEILIFTGVNISFVISQFSDVVWGLSDIFQTKNVFGWFSVVAIKAVLRAYFDSGNLLPVNGSEFLTDFRNLLDVLICARERRVSSSRSISFC